MAYAFLNRLHCDSFLIRNLIFENFSYIYMAVVRDVSKPYKRWSKCTMEKVGLRGKFFAAFFRNFGEDKISLLIVALISSAK